MADTRTIQILLVEDDDHDAVSFERTLSRSAEGVFSIRRMERAEELLALQDSILQETDILVMDHNLPGMSGLDLGLSLMDLEHIPPLVLLTGEGSEELASQALRSGFSDYMIKDPKAGYLNLLADKLLEVVKRRKLELSCQENRRRYRRLVEESPAIHYSFSLTRGCLFVSGKVEQVLGYSVDFVLENPFFWPDQVHPDDRQVVTDILNSIRSETNYTREYRVRAKDGSWVWLRDSSIHIRPSEQDTVIEGMLLDITQHKLFEQLKLDYDRMTHHDLRSPVAGILGLSRLLLVELGPDSPHHPHIKAMESSAYSMLTMLDRTLDMYRLEEGLFPTAAEKLDLDSLITDVLRSLTVQGKLTGPEVKVHCRGLTALGDPTLCWSVFSNLLTNALEADGTSETVMVSCESADDQTCIAIHNASPVPEEIRASFFEKYTTARKKKGLGLGTYSARLMVRAMNGSIRMRSGHEHGTTVEICLPSGRS